MKKPGGLGNLFEGRDWIFFVLSLLIAFVIWLVDNMSGSYVKTVSRNVVAQCSLEGYAAKSARSAVVLARCRTSGYDIVRMRRSSKAVVVEFSPSDMHLKDEELFYVTGAELNRYSQAIFGDDPSVEAVLTDTLFFIFHKENYKKVPVMPICSVDYKPQYMGIGGIKLTPDSVLVYGEPFHLEGIDRVYTRHFPLSGLDGPVHGEIALEDLKDVRLSQDKVGYSLEVSRFVEISSQVHIRPRNVPSGRSLVVYPSTAKVTYRCVFPLIGDPTDNVTFYVDYKDFAQSISGKCLPRNDGLPRGVLSYSLSPEVFECVENVK